MRKSSLRRAVTAATATAALAFGVAVAPVAAMAAATGDSIVSIAKRELADTSRNHEVGTNCSYYGGQMFGWPACGGKSGWGGGGAAYAWCAAFAKYVWREGGVTDHMSTIDGMAESFRTYGQDYGTWHSRTSGYVPQPGDAVVFDWGDDGPDIDHVGIVRYVKGSTLYTIEGNTSDRVAAHSYSRYANYSSIVGFTTPLGLTTDVPDEPEPDPWIADVTGDGYHDVVGQKADGTMWLFSNNIVRDNGTPYTDVSQIGSGWGNYTQVIEADVTGDGFSDLVGVKADGTMWLFSNNFVRDGGTPYTDVRQIGSGWNNYSKIIAADVTGDGFTDLVGVKADGTMWLFSNNIVRDGGTPYTDVRQIGSGWNNYTNIL
jgi:hypothetical protein